MTDTNNALKPNEVDLIVGLLYDRVVPKSAREGAAIVALANKFRASFDPPATVPVVQPQVAEPAGK